jgi:hypothetical protein
VKKLQASVRTEVQQSFQQLFHTYKHDIVMLSPLIDCGESDNEFSVNFPKLRTTSYPLYANVLTKMKSSTITQDKL